MHSAGGHAKFLDSLHLIFKFDTRLLKGLNFIEFNKISSFDGDCKKHISLHKLPFVSPKLKGEMVSEQPAKMLKSLNKGLNDKLG